MTPEAVRSQEKANARASAVSQKGNAHVQRLEEKELERHRKEMERIARVRESYRQRALAAYRDEEDKFFANLK